MQWLMTSWQGRIWSAPSSDQQKKRRRMFSLRQDSSSQACFFVPAPDLWLSPGGCQAFPLYPPTQPGSNIIIIIWLCTNASDQLTVRPCVCVCVCHSGWWITSCFPWAPCRRVTPSRRSAWHLEHTSRLEQTLSVILRTCVCCGVFRLVWLEKDAGNFLQKTKKVVSVRLSLFFFFLGWVIVGLRFWVILQVCLVWVIFLSW